MSFRKIFTISLILDSPQMEDTFRKGQIPVPAPHPAAGGCWDFFTTAEKKKQAQMRLCNLACPLTLRDAGRSSLWLQVSSDVVRNLPDGFRRSLRG